MLEQGLKLVHHTSHRRSSGKSTFVQSIAESDIDIYLVRGEPKPAKINAIDFIVESAKQIVVKIEKRIENLSMVEHVDEMALHAAHYEPEEMDPHTFEAKALAGGIAHIKKFIASAGTYVNLVKRAKSDQKIIDNVEAAGLIEKVETLKVTTSTRISTSVLTSTRTLLNLLMGLLQPCPGTTPKPKSIKLAKYSQHSADQLPYDKSPIEYFDALYREKHPEKDVMAWTAQLGMIGLSGQHQTSPTGQLSDGLRNRVVFAQLAMEHPHIPLLDEPTDHLDMTFIDALACAIKEYEGCVIIVWYDFRLISQVAEELREIKNKKIRNLTREDITIMQYKKLLVKESVNAFERAELFSKTQ
ncbi:P-loop containing nucleoside triphosphate hydrolase protein [Rickenella mellea]|uniref:P-loop containing nucleoside triphosphate hydrolase protein n=1 Tax=Rickenella mellea TaxID=50990 RepID=A0A4R5XIM1_9AGAM|nr:P-loop containing nucleoside triphosphate hydrolase protein [Rickenella mellea]